MIEPVYPKEDPEYRKRIMEDFYRKVKNTNWEAVGEDEYQGKPRGRKPKPKQGPPKEYYQPKRKKYAEIKSYVSLSERTNSRKTD